ncbi:hypothetical protein [Moraxella bovoculi]|nr:hypothetical protein [Moraxella bovoculi]
MNSIKQLIIITGIITLTACQSTPLPKPTTPRPSWWTIPPIV